MSLADELLADLEDDPDDVQDEEMPDTLLPAVSTKISVEKG